MAPPACLICALRFGDAPSHLAAIASGSTGPERLPYSPFPCRRAGFGWSGGQRPDR